MMVMVGSAANSQLLTFEFVGIAGSEVTVNSNTNATGVQASTISRGAGVTASGNGDRYNSNGWSTTTLDLTDYVEFTITPQSLYFLNITNIVVSHQRSGTGPVSFVMRTSLDGYASNATNINTIGDVTATQTSTFTFSSAINTTTAVGIRLYGYASEGAAGSWGPGDFLGNDIIVNGTAIAIPVPTTTGLTPPSATAGGAGFSLTVNGTNFVNGVSTVRWNGSDRATAFVSSTELTATINAADIAAAGSATVTVLNTGNPTESNGQTFTINAGGTPTITVSTTALTSFGAVVAPGNSAERTYTVEGTNLGGNITIQAPAGVEISLTSNTYTGTTGNSIPLTPSSGTVLTTNIYARFSPATATGFLNANITHTSPSATQRNVNVTGFAVVASPTLQSSITIGTISNTTIDLTLSGGDGLARIVVAKQGSAVDVDPADGPAYFDGGGIFTNGTDLGGGNFVVFDGAGTTVNVTGLTAGTTYHFAVYSYNSAGPGTINYLTPGGVNNATTSVPTYTWIGGNSAFTTAANWSPTRTIPSATDVLQFNDGATVTVTAVPTQTIGKLLVSNNTTVNLQTGAANTLTIGGGAGTDLSVAAGSALNIGGDFALTISMLTGTTGDIFGSMTLDGATASTAHRLLAADASSINVESGAVLTCGTFFNGNFFGSTGTTNVALLKSGSIFRSVGGSNPFGFGSPNSKVVFQPGSLYKYEVVAGTPSLSGRTYANFELANGGTTNISAGASTFTADRLYISNGTINITSNLPIVLKVDLEVSSGQTFNYSPAAATTLKFNGTSVQNILGTGTLAFGANATLELDNSTGLVLQRNVTVPKDVTLTNGKITLDANNLVTGLVSGGTSANYIKTNGTGALTVNNITTGKTLPIGNAFYNPLIIENGSGHDWTAKVGDGVVADGGFNTDKAVLLTWDITPSVNPTSTPADITFQFNEATQVGGTFSTGTNVQAWRRPSGAWLTTGVPAAVNTTVPNAATVKILSLSNFTPFALANIDGPLPVKFGDVKAYQQGNGIKVDWSNLTESGVVNYTIERSANGQLFAPLGTVNPTANNSNRADYSYFDAAPLTGINFYRIQSLEVDGKKLFSTIVRVSTKAGQTDITIYPNPVSGNRVSFQATALPKGQYMVRVTNAAGQQVMSKSLLHTGGSVTEVLELPATIKTGMYNILLSGADIKLTKTFIIR